MAMPDSSSPRIHQRCLRNGYPLLLAGAAQCLRNTPGRSRVPDWHLQTKKGGAYGFARLVNANWRCSQKAYVTSSAPSSCLISHEWGACATITSRSIHSFPRWTIMNFGPVATICASVGFKFVAKSVASHGMTVLYHNSTSTAAYPFGIWYNSVVVSNLGGASFFGSTFLKPYNEQLFFFKSFCEHVCLSCKGSYSVGI